MKTTKPAAHHLFGEAPIAEALCEGQAGCDGLGNVTTPEGRHGLCTCQIGRAARAARAATASRIPPRHFRRPPLEITGKRLADIVAVVERWAGQWEPDSLDGLVLAGKPRTGKSHIAGAAAVHMLGRLTPAFAIDRRPAVLWAAWPELLARIRDTYGRGRGEVVETETDILDELGRATITVIDDLGAEPRGSSDWTEGTLCRILERATADLSPTLIVTTNLTWPELRARYGERVSGRLLEAVSGPHGGVISFETIPNYLEQKGKA